MQKLKNLNKRKTKDTGTQVELSDFERRIREMFDQINDPISLQGQL